MSASPAHDPRARRASGSRAPGQRVPRGPGRPATRPNEQAIYAAGLAAFAEQGFAGASMRDIAGRAGTSLANLYNYVPSKVELLALLLRRANDRLLERLRDADDTAAPATARLTAVVGAYTAWTVAEQTAGVVALSEVRHLDGDLRAEVVDARDTTQRLVATVVEAGVAAGEFATPYPRAAARSIVLLCAAMATWYRGDGPLDARQIAAEQARLALALVEAHDPSHRDP